MTNNITEHIQNSARSTNATKNQTEHIQNSVRDTGVTNNQTEHKRDSERDTNATKNQTEHILNNALRLRQQTTKQNTNETVRETLT